MAKLIAIFNIKGGVGKTTSAVNLAYLAAKSGKKTLLWDMDHQGAAGFLLNVEAQLQGGLKSVLKDMEQTPANRHIADKIIATGYENLDLLPSDISMRLLDVKAAEAKGSNKFVEKLLAPLMKQYDYIFVDCPPGLTVSNESLLHAADLVLVPMIPTVLAVRMLEELRDYVKESIATPPKLRAFFTLMDSRKNMHKEIYDQLCIKRKTIILPITVPYASVTEKMSIRKAPLAVFAASSKSAMAYAEIWDSVKRMRL